MDNYLFHLSDDLINVLFTHLRKDSHLILLNERIKYLHDKFMINISKGSFNPDEIFDSNYNTHSLKLILIRYLDQAMVDPEILFDLKSIPLKYIINMYKVYLYGKHNSNTIFCIFKDTNSNYVYIKIYRDSYYLAIDKIFYKFYQFKLDHIIRNILLSKHGYNTSTFRKINL